MRVIAEWIENDINEKERESFLGQVQHSPGPGGGEWLEPADRGRILRPLSQCPPARGNEHCRLFDFWGRER